MTGITDECAEKMMNRFSGCLTLAMVFLATVCRSTLAFENNDHIARPVEQKVLTGRLEQLAGPGCTLPVELTIRSLQKESPKLAPAPKLEGVLAGYPDYMLGKWGGDFVVSLDTIPSGTPTLKVGQKCTSLFFFENGPQGIYLHPTTLIFPPVPEKLANNELFELDQLKKDYAAKGKKLTADDVISVSTVVSLGSIDFEGLAGETSDFRTLSNTLRELRRGVVEQDVVQYKLHVDESGKPSAGYLEYVCRFTWYRKDLVLAQLGTAYYDEKRQPWERQIFQGWITPNWKDSAMKLITQMQFPPDRIKTVTGVDVSELQPKQ